MLALQQHSTTDRVPRSIVHKQHGTPWQMHRPNHVTTKKIFIMHDAMQLNQVKQQPALFGRLQRRSYSTP
jgi:hypothetical protein